MPTRGDSRTHFVKEADVEQESEEYEDAYGLKLVNSDSQTRSRRWMVDLDLKARTKKVR